MTDRDQIDRSISLAIEAIRYKRERLYRAGWEITQQGGQDFFAAQDAVKFDELSQAMTFLQDLATQNLLEMVGDQENGKKRGQNGDLDGERYADIPIGKITAFWDQNRDKWRLLIHNNWTNQVETFYNPLTNEMMEFDTEPEAWFWYFAEDRTNQ